MKNRRQKMSGLRLALILAAPAAAPLCASPVHAQFTIQCGAATASPQDICTGEIAPADSMQRYTLNLRVTGVADTTRPIVRLRATSGTLLPDSLQVGPNGEVDAAWFRSRGADPVTIAVEARSARGSTFRYLELKPRTAATRTLVISQVQSFSPAGFENAPLRSPMIVEIRERPGTDTTTAALTNPKECESQRVVFNRSGSSGTVVPDSAIPTVYTASTRLSRVESWTTAKEGCFARAYWTLGEKPGVRQMRTSLVPASGFKTSQSPLVTNVRARANPRFVLGGILQYDGGYFGRNDGTARTIHVERTFPDGTKLSYDSTAKGTVSVDTVKTRFSPAVLVGVSSPVVLGWTAVNFTAGVDFTAPKDNWYLGFSLLRATGLSAESLPVDLHLLTHWGRTRELRHRSNCISGFGPDPCATRNHYGFRGVAVSMSVDAGSVVADAIKKLGT